MQITANTMIQGNAGLNIGDFLQMIQSMGAGQSSTADSSLMNIAAGGTDENPFSQVLLQQIAMLLQTCGIELSDASASREAFASTLQDLMDGDQAGTDDVLSGLALLAMTGQQSMQNVQNQSMISSGISSGEKPAARADTEATESSKAKGFLNAGQLTSFVVQAIQDSLKDTTSEGDEQTSIKTGLFNSRETTVETQKEGTQKDVKASKKAGMEFAAEIENLLQNKNDKAESMNISGLKEESRPKADSPATIISPAPSEKNTALSSDDLFKSAEAGQVNIKEKNIPADIRADKSAAGNTSAESQLAGVGVNVKTIIPESAAKLKIPVQGKPEGEPVDNNTAGVKDAAQKASSQTDVLNNDRKAEVSGHEFKNKAAGKDACANDCVTPESQAAADKIRPDLKSRTGNNERNSENNYFNTAAASSVTEAKTGTADTTSSTSIINRVAAEFNENLMTEGGRVKITLTPPSLGSLEMDVSVVNSRVKVMLVAENKDVQRILSGNIETLKTTLQTQGLTIERCDVMMQDSRDEYPHGFTGQHAFGQEQTSGERRSRTQTVEEESPKRSSIAGVQTPAPRPQYAGTESISLFA